VSDTPFLHEVLRREANEREFDARDRTLHPDDLQPRPRWTPSPEDLRRRLLARAVIRANNTFIDSYVRNHCERCREGDTGFLPEYVEFLAQEHRPLLCFECQRAETGQSTAPGWAQYWEANVAPGYAYRRD